MEKINMISYAEKMIEITTKIFEKSGWKVIESNNPTSAVDLIANLEDKKYYINIKCSSMLRPYRSLPMDFVNRFYNSYKNIGIPVYVCYFVLDKKQKELIENTFNNIIVLDLPNLLYAVKGTKLEKELISLLPYSIERIEYIEGKLEGLSFIEHGDSFEEMIKKYENCFVGRAGATSFENICFDMLKYSLADELALWEKQQKSNKELYRFDSLCRIKDNTGKSFWNIIENFFNSKYVVFEYKNYSDKITQKEIYTTEKYLYKTALRNVAIVIAKNGYSENALWAAKGCLRENGKLIILMNANELKEMCDMKHNDKDPNELLLTKLDELLITLEK